MIRALELRVQVRQAFVERTQATWREVVPATGLNPACRSEALLVRRTVENMVRVGELVAVGRTAPLPGSRVRLGVYELACQGDGGMPMVDPDQQMEALLRVTQSWVNFE
jgi:hypothetical protein